MWNSEVIAMQFLSLRKTLALAAIAMMAAQPVAALAADIASGDYDGDEFVIQAMENYDAQVASGEQGDAKLSAEIDKMLASEGA